MFEFGRVLSLGNSIKGQSYSKCCFESNHYPLSHYQLSIKPGVIPQPIRKLVRKHAQADDEHRRDDE